MKEKIKYRLGVGADAVAIDPETPDTMPDAFQSALPQELGGFKSEVQHLPPSKVRRCKAPHPSTINSSSLKTG